MRSTPPRRPIQPRSLMRTSYHVGRPWMFDGKILRGLTGTPMRRIERANNSFADAEPDPLTLANLTTKALMAVIGFMAPPCPDSSPLPLAGEVGAKRRVRVAPGKATHLPHRHPHPPLAPSPASGRREKLAGRRNASCGCPLLRMLVA